MELQEQVERYCATKVELMTFREEVAIQFGKVHSAIVETHVAIANVQTEISRLETKMVAMEARIIKWVIALAISNATISLAIARYFS